MQRLKLFYCFGSRSLSRILYRYRNNYIGISKVCTTSRLQLFTNTQTFHNKKQIFLTDKLHLSVTETEKCTRQSEKKGRHSRKYTSVEPNIAEEEFVFLDLEAGANTTEKDDVYKAPIAEDCLPKSKDKKTTTQIRQKSLEQRANYLEPRVTTKIEAESDIEFIDIGFPLSDSVLKKEKTQKQHKMYGSPDVQVPFSDACCSGCGAVMHCTDPTLAGYMPSEKYKLLTEENKLGNAVCQRCFLLVHHQKALDVQVSKEEYRKIVSGIRAEKALVLLIVDLLDLPNSIISGLLDLVGERKNIVVLGNKVDLLPGDSQNYLKRIKEQLFQYCVKEGIYTGNNIKDVNLVSAKTGYGIENLISSLQKSWKYKGDVYLVGSTTLNLLKFPIMNPTPYRMFKRSKRLRNDASQTENDLSETELRHVNQLKRQGYLVGRVGRTFWSATPDNENVDMLHFEHEDLSLSAALEESNRVSKPPDPAQFTDNELKYAHWLYDTPGIVKEDCVLNLLTEKELKMVVPTHSIVPRTFVLQPGMVLFLGALGRIDFLKGERACWLSVIASNLLPVHITSLEKADDIYNKHAGNTLLGVPIGGEERMKQFPPLIPKDIDLKGIGPDQAVADIKLSSAGWVAVTAQLDDALQFRVYTPAGTGSTVRSPPLLPHIVHVKGERIRKTPSYRTKKPEPLLVDRYSFSDGAVKGKLKGKK
ncbi:NOA1 protein, partial [Polyodon spathula]|nr:NOA1 protein [Polyodon spathula]